MVIEIEPYIRKIEYLRKHLKKWSHSNELRHYPWRNTDNPYEILIAELMLRRTRVDQVVPVYKNFIETYPDPLTLSKAKVSSIENILYSIGLKWRTSSFLEIAKIIANTYNGIVPNTRHELISLPGIGDYVAGAILSFAFNMNEWIVDSNIVRLYKRFFGYETTKEGRRDKHIIETSKLYISIGNAKILNIALLDFSSLICTFRTPKCQECILKESCRYFIFN
ncbi:MAG: DNA glycosylase [Candidatus Cloacimonetes bacterium]|nr:DNA glycosylase [Candidatus Cloacimonadota bacterium]